MIFQDLTPTRTRIDQTGRQKDHFEYLLGVDYTFFGKIDSNFQFFQQIILNPGKQLVDDPLKTFCSIWLQTGFFENRLQPELFVVSSLEQADFMIRPRLNYIFNANWAAALGVDIFGGVEDGDFGQFNDEDRVYVELSYTF